MKCEQILNLLEDFRSGELDENRASDVSAHLRNCASCRHVLALMDQEEKVYQAYAAKAESTLELSPDSWRAARERQEAAAERGTSLCRFTAGWRKRWSPVSPWARQALAAALLVAISVAGTLWIVGRHGNVETAALPDVATTAGAIGDRGLEAALIAVQRAELEYQKAIQQLSALVEKQKSILEPGIMAELQANLRSIDEHIAATRKAYYAHPQDPELALYMLAAYSRKVELLQELTS
jgi:tetratricopeptide (TPR) repeat protein